jgi:hypothetical protein
VFCGALWSHAVLSCWECHAHAYKLNIMRNAVLSKPTGGVLNVKPTHARKYSRRWSWGWGVSGPKVLGSRPKKALIDSSLNYSAPQLSEPPIMAAVRNGGGRRPRPPEANHTNFLGPKTLSRLRPDLTPLPLRLFVFKSAIAITASYFQSGTTTCRCGRGVWGRIKIHGSPFPMRFYRAPPRPAL